MKYSKIKYFCTVNSIGLSTSIFVSGCDLKCEGCFNKLAWSYDVGKELTDDVIEKVLKSIEPNYISALSILGGEPLAEKNLEGVNFLIDTFRKKFGDTKKIWLWSGRYLSELDEKRLSVIKKCDYFVDGRFEQDKYDPNLKFRGSSNQTIWENKNGEFIKSDLNE